RRQERAGRTVETHDRLVGTAHGTDEVADPGHGHVVRHHDRGPPNRAVVTRGIVARRGERDTGGSGPERGESGGGGGDAAGRVRGDGLARRHGDVLRQVDGRGGGGTDREGAGRNRVHDR